MSSAMAGLPTGSTSAIRDMRDAVRRIAQRWAAIGDAAQAVRIMAQAPERAPCAKDRQFGILIRDIEDARKQILSHGVDDLTAIMQPGLAALLATIARGQDATIAAGILWEEYMRTRDALLALLPDPGQLGPRRAA